MRTCGSIANACDDQSDDFDSDFDEEEHDQNVPNALFLRWLKEFHDEKDWRKRRGPPRPTGYENAVIAVRMCKVKYDHPADLYVLKGVGPTCVERLTEKLEEHCKMNGIKTPLHPSQRQASSKPSRRARKDGDSANSQNRVRKSSVQYQEQDSNKRRRDSDDDDDGARVLRRRLSDLEPEYSKSKSEALAELRASRAARKNRL